MNRREAGDVAATEQVFRFADVIVNVPAHCLSRNGQEVPLEPKAFSVLLVLLQHAGDLVPRDDLIDAVWGHHHVTPSVLTRAIAQLRHALGDDPHAPRYIQTQHALGYRFIGELAASGADAPEEPKESSENGLERRTHHEERRHARLPLPVMLELTPANDLDRPDDEPRPDSGVQPEADTPIDQAPAIRETARWPRRAILVAVGIAAALAMASLWLGRNLPLPAPPADASVAILPVTHVGSGQEDTYFADGLVIELLDALAGVPGLKVAARPQGAGANRDVKKLGQTMGVASVLDIAIRRSGDRVRISARLVDTGSGFTLWSESYDRELTDVFAVQTDIASRVVHALLGVMPKQDLLARRLAPTGSFPAYDAYLKGVAAVDAGIDPERAIGFFRQALATDAGFAKAQSGICRAEIQRLESNRDAPRFDLARAACNQAKRMAPDLHEVNLAFGDLYRVQGRYDVAAEQYTEALKDEALRADAYIGLGITEAARGQIELAREFYKRAIDLRPGDGDAYRELGYHYYQSGDLEEAAAAYRTAASLMPDDSRVWSSLGGIYLASGDRDRATDAFRRSLAVEPNYAALSNLGTLKFELGQYAQAAGLFRQAVDFMPDDFRTWGNLADALAASPATAKEARAAFAHAAALARPYVSVSAADAEARAQLAWFEANLDQAQQARELVAEAEAIGKEQAPVALWAAQTLALLGDEAAARDRVEQARRHGVTEDRIRSVPVLRPLLATSKADPDTGDDGAQAANGQ